MHGTSNITMTLITVSNSCVLWDLHIDLISRQYMEVQEIPSREWCVHTRSIPMWSTPLWSILTRAILYDVNYQDINFHRINSVRIQLNSSNQLGIDISIHTLIRQRSYLWAISACQRSICIDRYDILSTIHTQYHFLQWLSFLIPTEEERPFTLRGISTRR